MTVTLEALDAKQGDALLVRYVHDGREILWVVDGGPGTVYDETLEPRLAEIKAERAIPDADPLPIDLVVVSHIDQDHIIGVTAIVRAMKEAKENGDPAPYALGAVWHNAYRKLLPHGAGASVEGTLAAGVAPDDEVGQAIIESVDQGSKLDDLVRWAGREGNPPFKGLVHSRKKKIDDIAGADITVVAPTHDLLELLADEWEKKIQAPVDRGELAKTASYEERTASNLSSIVLYVEIQGKTLLLTGDARGDKVLDCLQAVGLLTKGTTSTMEVDLLKVPHHGSDRNLDLDFFERIKADHYVFSSDGTDDNPSTKTLRWLAQARKDDDYAVHLTYRDANHAKATMEAAVAELGGSSKVTTDWGVPGPGRVVVTL